MIGRAFHAIEDAQHNGAYWPSMAVFGIVIVLCAGALLGMGPL